MLMKNDLIAGHLPMSFGTVAQALPQYKAGVLKALAVSSWKRYPSIPDVPTFKEQGFDAVTTERHRPARPRRHTAAGHSSELYADMGRAS